MSRPNFPCPITSSQFQKSGVQMCMGGKRLKGQGEDRWRDTLMVNLLSLSSSPTPGFGGHSYTFLFRSVVDPGLGLVHNLDLLSWVAERWMDLANCGRGWFWGRTRFHDSEGRTGCWRHSCGLRVAYVTTSFMRRVFQEFEAGCRSCVGGRFLVRKF